MNTVNLVAGFCLGVAVTLAGVLIFVITTSKETFERSGPPPIPPKRRK